MRVQLGITLKYYLEINDHIVFVEVSKNIGLQDFLQIQK